MESTSFNLQSTIDSIIHALNGVVCHILFDASIHGLIVALAIFIVGLSLKGHKPKLSKPLQIAAGKLSIFCGILTIPGFITLLITGGLPETGYYTSNSIGFISFWSLASVWLCGEHINHQWFSVNKPKQVNKISSESDSNLASGSASNSASTSTSSSASNSDSNSTSSNEDNKSSEDKIDSSNESAKDKIAGSNKSDETSEKETTSKVSESLPKEKTYG